MAYHSIDRSDTSSSSKKRGRLLVPKNGEAANDPTAIASNESWGAVRKLKDLGLDNDLGKKNESTHKQSVRIL